MSDIKPKCSTCDYFNLLLEEKAESLGECKRRAPVAITVNEIETEGRIIEKMVPWAVWPRVFGGSWCGEHSKR
jgi:hypothetical protein